MNERAKICIDRVMPRKRLRFQSTRRVAGGVLRAINPRGTAWINGSTLSVRFIGGSAAQKAIAREQAGWWSQVANLKFDFKDAPNADIRIAFDSTDGAWSWIGTECKDIPNNEPTMNLGFLDGGTAAHEFGHAIGLAHEHQSPHGGLKWIEAVVIEEMAKSPNFWDADTTRHNILRKYTAQQVNGTAFDPDSIMLYFFPPEWTTNGIGSKANDVLSAMDKAFIAGAKMYPKMGATAATATALTVNAQRRTKAAIGRAGEEDVFKFNAGADGRYHIDTRGPTNMVMKLFGPNSPTALIAEDDDSGVDANARIVADLISGEYFVQVRHVNRTGGTGDYSVKVRRV